MKSKVVFLLILVSIFFGGEVWAQGPSILGFVGSIPTLPYLGKIARIEITTPAESPTWATLYVTGCREAAAAVAEAFRGSPLHIVEVRRTTPGALLWEAEVEESTPLAAEPLGMERFQPGGLVVYEWLNPLGQAAVIKNCNQQAQRVPVPELVPAPVFSLPPVEEIELSPVAIAFSALVLLVIGAAALRFR